MTHQQTSNEFEKLKQEEAEKSSRLQELMYVDPVKSNKLTNDYINTQLATPKKSIFKQPKALPPKSVKTARSKWNSDDLEIEHICDYFDELQYHCDYFPSSLDNKSSKTLYQYSQLTKLRKNILNRKLIEHRQRVKSEKGTKTFASLLSSAVESMTIPSLQFHILLSLTMVLLTHQCPQYLIVY